MAKAGTPVQGFNQRLLDIFDPPKVTIWTPYPKQMQAATLADQVFELLYGGAAGGGKSMFLRGYAVEFCLDHPGAHVGIVRQTLPMLKQTHGLHLASLVGNLARENRTDNTWTFKNNSVIRFVSLPNVGDEQNYKSVEFDILLFDEVTEIEESQYTFMLSRVRSARGYRAHVIATSNPEGRGFRWVKRRWVTPAVADLAPGQSMPQEYEPWNPPLIQDGEMVGLQPNRAFIPATVMDNPGLMENNPTYVLQLQSLPDGRMRRALLHGDWTAMDQVPGALWNQSIIDENRVARHPDLVRVVVGVDPSGSSHNDSDECGIIVVGLGNDGRYYVIRDTSGVIAPEVWSARVQVAFDETSADCVVAEKNYGGDMVAAVLQKTRRHLPVKLVTASRGKAVRAEPISYLYSQGRVSHVGTFLELEDELTTWVPGDGWSPGRLDALVWAITELTAGGAMEYLNAISIHCISCGMPNVKKALNCFGCGESLTQDGDEDDAKAS